MATTPAGACATIRSCPTAVGFGVASPATTSMKAGSMSTIAAGFHHCSMPQLGS